ncbi:MAG: nuclear transport factor 2 family protein [Myxococcota bacterium]
MTHANAEILDTFYRAFQAKDGDAMAAVYADDATFTDPVFRNLKGREVGGMWRMLCKRGKDLEVTYEVLSADDAKGEARWEAWYTFSATGRKVHNTVRSSFTFRDGQVLTQVDEFDLYAWTRMALGPMGLLLGWSPLVQNKVRRTARGGLEAFLAKDAA